MTGVFPDGKEFIKEFTETIKSKLPDFITSK
jgi:hypothetical protein